jgi:predicted ATPase
MASGRYNFRCDTGALSLLQAHAFSFSRAAIAELYPDDLRLRRVFERVLQLT